MTILSTLDPGQEVDVSEHVGLIPTYKKVEILLTSSTYDRLRKEAEKPLHVSPLELSEIIREINLEGHPVSEHMEMIKIREREWAKRKDPLWFEHYLRIKVTTRLWNG